MYCLRTCDPSQRRDDITEDCCHTVNHLAFALYSYTQHYVLIPGCWAFTGKSLLKMGKRSLCESSGNLFEALLWGTLVLVSIF